MTENPAARCDGDIVINEGYTDQAVHWLLCLRSWQNSEVITLDQRLLRRAVIEVDRRPHDEDDDDAIVPTAPGVVQELLREIDDE